MFMHPRVAATQQKHKNPYVTLTFKYDLEIQQCSRSRQGICSWKISSS